MRTYFTLSCVIFLDRHRTTAAFHVPRCDQRLRELRRAASPEDLEALRNAAGSGVGKHGRAAKRSKKNKYAKDSKAASVDPLEAQYAASKAYADEQEKLRKRREKAWFERLEGGWIEEEDEEEEEYTDGDGNDERGDGRGGKTERLRERGARIYPDEALIDPYDPSTFGFVFVGTVLGAHGLTGELKVRAISDFAQERLGSCEGGRPVHLKAPDRRFPKRHLIVSGRPMGGGGGGGGGDSSGGDGGGGGGGELGKEASSSQQQQQQQQDVYLVRLRGVRSREDAARLRLHGVYVWQTERQQALQGDEYLVEDLVGLRCLLGDALSTGSETGKAAVIASSSSSSSSSSDGSSGHGALPELSDEELAGLPAVGEVIGVVTRDEVCSTAFGHDLLEVQVGRGPQSDGGNDDSNGSGDVAASATASEEPMTVLIPLVPQIVPFIDVGRGVLVMEPPPGLLELAAPKKKEKFRIRALLPEKAECLEERRREKALKAARGAVATEQASAAVGRPIWDQREDRHSNTAR